MSCSFIVTDESSLEKELSGDMKTHCRKKRIGNQHRVCINRKKETEEKKKTEVSWNSTEGFCITYVFLVLFQGSVCSNEKLPPLLEKLFSSNTLKEIGLTDGKHRLPAMKNMEKVFNSAEKQTKVRILQLVLIPNAYVAFRRIVYSEYRKSSNKRPLLLKPPSNKRPSKIRKYEINASLF